MNWSQPVDIYCERLDPGFWAEPVNALSNLAFVLAGLAALALARRTGRGDAAVVLLSANAVAVGIGSFLFHTVATRWAGLADVLPILVFILGYFAAAMNRFVGLGWGRAVLATLGFLAGAWALGQGLALLPEGLTRGWGGYAPALVALIGVGLWLRARGHRAGPALMQAGGVFALSLGFRTLDGPLCDALALGTHFLWHLLNGLMLWLLLRALILHGRVPADAARPA